MPYQSYIKKVPGQKSKEVMLFTLSTCSWCKKTKALLNNLGLEHSYVDVDLLFGHDQAEAYEAMSKLGNSTSFPTIIINNGEDIIIGFAEDKLKKLK